MTKENHVDATAVKKMNDRARRDLQLARDRVNELEDALGMPRTSFASPLQAQAESAIGDTRAFAELDDVIDAAPARERRQIRRAATKAGRAPAKKTAKKARKGARGPRPGSMVDKAWQFLKQHPGTTTEPIAKKFGVTRVRASGLYGQLRTLKLARSEGSHADMLWYPVEGE